MYPDNLSPQDRIQEIARLLVGALLRLHGQGSEKS